MSASARPNLSVGAQDRETGKVRAKPVAFTDRESLQGFVGQTTDEGSAIFTDEAKAYVGMHNRLHRSVRHSVGEYVRRQAHTNGIESFWAMLKRGYQGVYHQMSPHHLRRYVTEFEGRHNDSHPHRGQLTYCIMARQSQFGLRYVGRFSDGVSVLRWTYKWFPRRD